MENSNKQICQGLPHYCSAGIQAPKTVIKPEINVMASALAPAGSDNKKPWSIFGDVYWI